MRGCETAARQEEDLEEEAAVEVEPWSSKARLGQEYVGVLHRRRGLNFDNKTQQCQ